MRNLFSFAAGVDLLHSWRSHDSHPIRDHQHDGLGRGCGAGVCGVLNVVRHPHLDPRNNGAVITSTEAVLDQAAESLLAVVDFVEIDMGMNVLPDPYIPFMARVGKGCEDMIEGWYFRDDRNVLSGPYTTELDCEAAIEEAKYVEAR